jgi:putative CocE/NonD family hydrolase
MGPWVHGGWARTDGDKLGQARFDAKTSLHYRTTMELAFFEHFLRDVDARLPAEANMFDTGANEWRAFDAWPPRGVAESCYWFDAARSQLSPKGPITAGQTCRAFVSDPNRPVPFTSAITTQMTKEYMTEDQRFAASRPDVQSYTTPALEQDLTLAGPVVANLVVTTSGTDGDWIVKLIDVFPDDTPDPKGEEALAAGQRMGGYQMLVRSEVVRGRFRDDPSKPIPFEPGRLTDVEVPLVDVLHTFKAGHKMMVQVQCSWFPLVDRNPQTFVPNIYEAREEDFVSANVAVWNASKLTFSVLPDSK